MRSRFLPAAAAALVPLAAAGADLVDPWAPGLSNLELHVSHSEGDRQPTVSGVLGFGVGGWLSLGVLLVNGPDDGRGVGLVAVATRSWAGGHALDVWAEVGQRLVPREAELGRACATAGAEWSLAREPATPYLRVSVSRESAVTTMHPLVGARVRVASRVELHLELSSEEPEGGPWPLHLAVGPNLLLGRTVKVVPEVSYVRDRNRGDGTWSFSLGVVVDPRGLLADGDTTGR